MCAAPQPPPLNNGIVVRPLLRGGVFEYCIGRFIKTCIDSGCWGLEITIATRATTRSSKTIPITITTIINNITGTTIYELLHTAYYLRTQ